MSAVLDFHDLPSVSDTNVLFLLCEMLAALALLIYFCKWLKTFFQQAVLKRFS
jgi:hypothetical protein